MYQYLYPYKLTAQVLSEVDATYTTPHHTREGASERETREGEPFVNNEKERTPTIIVLAHTACCL